MLILRNLLVARLKSAKHTISIYHERIYFRQIAIDLILLGIDW